ncbi:hypothetical protein G3I01_11695 [Gramella sp. MT6]|uniref:hypothetical protein n=1 Tax=Gramella sp. MT6 TaxID=2705471 RepID=UPI001C5E399D|nr:hypothetical protein [Gramella sp. MT6]QYA26147.1 hypothetical protein G3I01_11695 [Gramella sp. MT6]
MEDFFKIYKRIFNSFFKTGFPLILILILIFTFFVLENYEKTDDLSAILNKPEFILSLAGLTITVFFFLFQYLESGKSNLKESKDVEYELEEIKNLIRKNFKNREESNESLNKIFQEFKTEINSTRNQKIDLTEIDKEKLYDILSDKIDKNLTSEILNSINEKYGELAIEHNRYNELLRDLHELKFRIISEIKQLSKRANINLGIGSALTVVAGAVLWITVISTTLEFQEITPLLSFYIPRLSIIIFIEVFSFFFLKLYKANLDNIKYYHNEMTNIELKITSLKSSLMKGDKDLLSNVINELSQTERNFIIPKGNTTIELERIKTEKNNSDKLIKLLKSTISKN